MSIKNNTTSLQALLEMANNLPDAGLGGGELPELTNEGSASDLLSGKQLIDSDGNVVTGTIVTKTASNLTASGATVTVPSGYYASQATKNVGTATQATPSISVNSSGLITATATQSAGYVSAGTKSATKQLTTQAAKTITPTTSNQTAVASGVYTTGTVTVKGDSNLVAGNIKSGVSIFGVSGTYAGSGGGDTSMEDGLVTRTISSYTNDRVTTIGSYAFYNYFKLTTVSFPAATTISNYAFYGCTSLPTVSFPAARTIGTGAFSYCARLKTVSFPAATTIGSFAFSSCASLTKVSFPVATTIGSSAFYECTKLTKVSFSAATTIGSSAFCRCYNLKSLYLTGSSLCKLLNSNAFSSTPIGGYSTSAYTYGSIYVPASLLASYKTATNWTYFSSRFVGI